MTSWHSVQLPAEHWSWWCHTIPIMVANTSTINKVETTTRQIRVEPAILKEPERASTYSTASILNHAGALAKNYL